MKNDNLYNVLLIMAAIFYCCFCFVLPSVYPDPFTDANRKIEITIETGMSAREAADIIKEAGIVSDENALVKWMETYEIDRTIRPGVYELNSGNAMFVARQLKNSTPRTYSVTIIPGTRYKDIVRAVYSSDGKDEIFESELADDTNYPEDMRAMLPSKPRDRIIFLLPETYFLAPGEDIGKQFIKRASKLWFERIGKNISKEKDKNYIIERGIIASLVEGEAKIPEERPILSGIFISRIGKNMRLQSCATVIYCWDERGEKKSHLTYKDLEIDSPYNTYLYHGLPPGPISVPSEASWQSAFNPQKNEYLFFFATDKGNHIFSRTYEEHLRKQNEAIR